MEEEQQTTIIAGNPYQAEIYRIVLEHDELIAELLEAQE